MRTLPEVELSPCPEGYARLLGQGFDTVQEAFALQLSPAFVDLLEKTQAAARELSDELEATVEVSIGTERFKAHATGARGGFRWRLENDDFLLMIGSPKRDWTISCRYLSGGLWEHGLEALRARAFEALRPYTQQSDPDCIRVSRADWCFDFFSPAFSVEFVPGLSRSVVCHSSAKAREQGGFDLWARGGRGETLTIGSKSGLQSQIYNKTLEIDEASGKTWLYDAWVAFIGGEWIFDGEKPHDVWRLELRWFSDYLKERNIRRPHELKARMGELIAEALYTRRLGVPNDHDDNRWRWPMHPLWSEAVRLRASGEMVPLGRKITGRRDALVQMAEASVAGALRSAAVLENGTYDAGKVVSLMERARARIEADPRHAKKIEAAQSRYSTVEEAR